LRYLRSLAEPVSVSRYEQPDQEGIETVWSRFLGLRLTASLRAARSRGHRNLGSLALPSKINLCRYEQPDQEGIETVSSRMLSGVVSGCRYEQPDQEGIETFRLDVQPKHSGESLRAARSRGHRNGSPRTTSPRRWVSLRAARSRGHRNGDGDRDGTFGGRVATSSPIKRA